MPVFGENKIKNTSNKILIGFLAVAAMLTFTACGGNNNQTSKVSSNKPVNSSEVFDKADELNDGQDTKNSTVSKVGEVSQNNKSSKSSNISETDPVSNVSDRQSESEILSDSEETNISELSVEITVPDNGEESSSVTSEYVSVIKESSTDENESDISAKAITIKGGVNEEGDILDDETVEYDEGDTWKDIVEKYSNIYINDRNPRRGDHIVVYPKGGHNSGVLLSDGKLVRTDDIVSADKNYYLEIC